MVAYYTKLREWEINDHLKHLNLYEVFVIACCVVMTTLILVIAVLVPYMSFKAFLDRYIMIELLINERQKKITDMLCKLDKKLVLNLITSVEEEVELLSEGEETASTNAPKIVNKSETKNKRPILPTNYVISLISYLILGCVFLYVVVNHIRSTSTLPGDFNVHFDCANTLGIQSKKDNDEYYS
jgi:hypothetical protein